MGESQSRYRNNWPSSVRTEIKPKAVQQSSAALRKPLSTSKVEVAHAELLRAFPDQELSAEDEEKPSAKLGAVPALRLVFALMLQLRPIILLWP